MVLVTVFAVALLVAVLFSGLAARTVLSASVLFLLAGALAGPGVLGLVEVTPRTPLVSTFADLALFAVLFTDGMRLGLRDLTRSGSAPARALLIGMPLTVLGIALLTKSLTSLSWVSAFLVGAVLSPTDPVFASAIVGRQDVPQRLRRLLNVESGLNDGLALPLVLLLLTFASGQEAHVSRILLELGLGLLIGLVLPALMAGLIRVPGLGASRQLRALGPFAVGMLVFTVSHLTHANHYIAAFVAGSTIATVAPTARDTFEPLGEQVAELTKFAALLVFGALLTPMLFSDLGVGGYAVAVMALLVVRPLLLSLSLVGLRMPRRERAVAAWFGPKGFASVVYGLLLLKSGVPDAHQAFEIIAVCVAISIVVHSSTDVPISKLFHVEREAGLARNGRETETSERP